MIRNGLFVAVLVLLAAGTAAAAPEHQSRPAPEWLVEACADFDVC